MSQLYIVREAVGRIFQNTYVWCACTCLNKTCVNLAVLEDQKYLKTEIMSKIFTHAS